MPPTTTPTMAPGGRPRIDLARPTFDAALLPRLMGFQHTRAPLGLAPEVEIVQETIVIPDTPTSVTSDSTADDDSGFSGFDPMFVENDVQLFVTTFTGKTKVILMRPLATVMNIKYEIQRIEGIPTAK